MPKLRPWQIAVYGGTLLYLAFEIARSLWRADLVVFSGYLELGESILAGRDPYHIHLNTWPPFFGLVAAALALVTRVLGIHAALLLWQLGSVLAIWGCCRLLARAFEDGGDTLTFWPTTPDRLCFVSSAVLVPVLLSARILQEHLQHTQVNLFLLLLALIAFDRFRAGRAQWGGLALAAAASVKAAPVLLIGYLVYRRRWRETAWTAAWLVMLNVVVPAIAFGPAEAREQWHSWSALAAREIADPASAHRFNQSLLAAVNRLVADPQVGRLAFYGVAGLLAVGLALAFRGGSTELRSRRAAGEWAISLVAMTLVTPLAWKAHYVTLLAGYWCVWWGLRQLPPGTPGRRWGLGLLGASLLLVSLSAPAVVGGQTAAVLESLNTITLGALLVVGLGVLLLRRLPRLPPASSETRSAP
ncbi:MAG TPA: glycosyltransferase family 87 protein [Gemmatimonadales bacterium]|nr:glycosyltransferase family 87 protein [Gemmatimonadales bacterium]